MSDAEIPWFDRVRAGFRKTSERLGDNLTGLFTRAALDAETLEKLIQHVRDLDMVEVKKKLEEAEPMLEEEEP